jgi:hypothetical protein
MEAANATVNLTREIERIGERLGSRHTKACANDLAEVARATRAITAAIDDMQAAASVSPEAVGKALVEVQMWAYEELHDHLERLRQPLSMAIDEVYGVSDRVAPNP